MTPMLLVGGLSPMSRNTPALPSTERQTFQQSNRKNSKGLYPSKKDLINVCLFPFLASFYLNFQIQNNNSHYNTNPYTKKNQRYKKKKTTK